MENKESLIPEGAREEKKKLWDVVKGGAFLQELKSVSSMAIPMVIVSVSQFLVQVVSMMMAGHLGELSLSGASIATSFADVTGFILLVSFCFF